MNKDNLEVVVYNEIGNPIHSFDANAFTSDKSIVTIYRKGSVIGVTNLAAGFSVKLVEKA